MTTKNYRADVDGLRALAILPVVLFHASSSALPGGYLGVDVFFVISGYLIAGLILAAIDARQFSFAQFYYRRLKRLMPAYAVMILATLGVGLLLLTPRELIPFAKTALASVFSVSNFQLALFGNYFAPDTATNPLMHTWSLAIEEQFYLIFPLFAWALYRKSNLWFGIALFCLVLVSLAVAISHENVPSPWAHYSPLARAWQLAAGCWLAMLHLKNPNQPRRLTSEVASIAAVCLLGILFVVGGEEVLGAQAALGTAIAAMAVIHFGRCASGTIVSRVLSTRPLVLIGLVSYSTYLWHQPLIAYARLFPASDSLAFVPLVTLASIGIGWASWRFVETPTRHTALPAARVVPRIAAVLFVAAVVAGASVAGRGFPERFPETARLDRTSFEGAEKSVMCGQWTKEEISTDDLCVIEANSEVDPAYGTIAIWGDSHAGSLFSGFLVTEHPFPVVSMAFHGCFVGHTKRVARNFRNCIRKRDVSFGYLDAHPDVKTVIVHARWEFSLSSPQIREETLAAIARIVASNRNVILVDSVPVQRREVLPFHNRLAALGLDPSQKLPIEDYHARLAKQQDVLRDLASNPEITFVPVEDLFCDRGQRTCSSHDSDGTPLYEDQGHLNSVGAKRIADHLVQNVLPSIP